MAEPDRTNADAERVSDIVAGWRLVPVEPMPEMLAAWYRYKNGHHFADEPPPGDTSDYGAYRAMLAAAPVVEAADIIEAQSKALAEARAALTDIASLTQTEKLLWWQMRARVALSFLTPTPENPNG